MFKGVLRSCRNPMHTHAKLAKVPSIGLGTIICAYRDCWCPQRRKRIVVLRYWLWYNQLYFAIYGLLLYGDK